MILSYVITVCSELKEIQKLLPFLLEHKRDEDEIVIIRDSKNGSNEVMEYLYHHIHALDFHQYNFEFNGDFSALKNYAKSKCRGDYIVALDADEQPHETLMEQLPQIIEMNEVDLIYVPRINTVSGITNEYILNQGWKMDNNGWINFPDVQSRIFKNVDNIKWQGKVHETIKGYKTVANLPLEEDYCLYHHKTFEKQKQQNRLYDEINK